jgi:hypothetical protein
METYDSRHFFQVQVFPGDLKPERLSVDLYTEPVQDGGLLARP